MNESCKTAAGGFEPRSPRPGLRLSVFGPVDGILLCCASPCATQGPHSGVVVSAALAADIILRCRICRPLFTVVPFLSQLCGSFLFSSSDTIAFDLLVLSAASRVDLTVNSHTGMFSLQELLEEWPG